jgi:thiamine-monophosphate kinase
MDEFSVIEKYFEPLTMGHVSAAGLQDDGAVLGIPEGCELVVTSDTLNEGVHFMIGEAPEIIACKALRVNLSDLASMGAKPHCYQLNIAFPVAPKEDWLKEFSDTLLEENKRFGVFCSGGDTTSIISDYLSISITALGFVPRGKAVRRGGAKDGDAIILTGVVGDAALGLKLLLERTDSAYKLAITRYILPEPRVGIEGILQEYVNAAADISDGLIADCQHIAHASGLGMEIDLDALKFSKDVQMAIKNGDFTVEKAVCGGDDYELVMAVSKGEVHNLLAELEKSNLNPLVIGKFLDNGLKTCLIGNERYRIERESKGWKHF